MPDKVRSVAKEKEKWRVAAPFMSMCSGVEEDGERASQEVATRRRVKQTSRSI